MMEFFHDFAAIINSICDNPLKQKLTVVYDSIYNCAKRMSSATKFIDFFVQDILDYTLLNKDEKNFTKNITIFNIKIAVNEIIDILNGNMQMKQINIQVKLLGFDEDGPSKYLVKSDMKRIQ